MPTLFDPSDADRSPPKERVLTGWPLTSVRMHRRVDAQTELVDGLAWPPPRLASRTHRLELFDRLWQGDLTDFVTDPSAVQLGINYFRRIIQTLSALMTTSGPQIELLTPATDLIINSTLYGRGYLVRVGDDVWSPQTSEVWEDEDGSLHIIEQDQSIEAADQTLDRWIGTTISPDGRVVDWEREAVGSVLGPVVTEFAVDEQGDWAVVDNPPVRQRWGQSILLDLIPPTVGLALRLTGAEHVLAANEAPTTVLPAPDADIAEAVAGSDNQPKTVQELGRREAQAQLTAMRGYHAVWGPDGLDRGYVLEWTGNLDNSWSMVDALKAELRMLTGVGAALEAEGMDVPSGAALRQMYLILWATTRQLHGLIVAAFEEVGLRIEWPNPFEEPIGEAAPAPQIAPSDEDDPSAPAPDADIPPEELDDA